MKIINIKKKIAIVVSRFNHFINKNLLSGALDILKRIGKIKKKNIKIITVPGAFEIPLIIKNLACKKKYNAIITLGAIIKGDTKHSEYISQQTSSGIAQISLDYNIPISYGILTTNNIAEAIDRSGGKMGNKGSEAALCALEMIKIIKKINQKN
ncbi:6,7-dimethyl-8-ribityllumazine synthase [Buchnera aphidicola (Mollitrichosiphum nigrofasciatum)]|uniref:6,7-dimethyl-8-ribityllumazine synthase n=1 Tax=Buchnera aphidicola TaxID=9 RepID=UPI0031B894D3